MAGIDEIDGCNTPVEHDGGKLGIDIPPLSIYNNLVVRPYYQAGRGRGMQQPMPASHQVVGITSTHSEMVGADCHIGTVLGQVAGRIQLTALIGEACQP